MAGIIFHWETENYFDDLLKTKFEDYSYALELLVGDLHRNKQKTVNKFICHNKSDKYFRALLSLLANIDVRVAGNTAYVFGSIVETEVGCYRFLSLLSSDKTFEVLKCLVQMLQFNDSETVMNAAGTLGTLAESKEGRQLILEDVTFDELLFHVSNLLIHDDIWTASNAALVLARISISDDGCSKVLQHSSKKKILRGLCCCLGNDEAGKGMNAAFALGRLVDTSNDWLTELHLYVDTLVADLIKMVQWVDISSCKNACFCLSCMAASPAGHSMIIADETSIKSLLSTLVNLLSVDDGEVAWFAALTIRTVTSKPKGAIIMKNDNQLLNSIKCVLEDPKVLEDVKEELVLVFEYLKPLPVPGSPSAKVLGERSIELSWNAVELKSGFSVGYQLFIGQQCIYSGDQCSYVCIKLQPNTAYSFRIRLFTEGDVGQFSDPVTAVTEESVAGPPINLRIDTTTATQIRVFWEPPTLSQVSIIKGYLVQCNDNKPEFTTELTSIISGLSPSTSYTVTVCTNSAKGKSAKVSVVGSTLDLGAHAPPKPTVNVLGRHTLSVIWEPPERPLGRLNRYDVLLNGRRTVYSGTDLSCKIHGLSPDTEYSVTIVAVTNEGKSESQARRKRTTKDEFDPQRAPLWAPNRRLSVNNEQDILSNNNTPPVVKKSVAKEIKPFVKRKTKSWQSLPLASQTVDSSINVASKEDTAETACVDETVVSSVTSADSKMSSTTSELNEGKDSGNQPVVKHSYITFNRFNDKNGGGFLSRVAPAAVSKPAVSHSVSAESSASTSSAPVQLKQQLLTLQRNPDSSWSPNESEQRKLRPLKSKKHDKSVWVPNDCSLHLDLPQHSLTRKRPLPSLFGSNSSSNAYKGKPTLTKQSLTDNLLTIQKQSTSVLSEWTPDFPPKKSSFVNVAQSQSVTFLPSYQRQSRQRTSLLIDRLHQRDAQLPIVRSSNNG